jgi:hypothetical protein
VHRLGSCLVLCVLAACGSESAIDGLYTLRLDRYEPTDPPTPLRISNETLLLPLTGGERVQELSRDSPGDLVLAYTRIDCSVGDPTPHLTRSDIDLPPGPEVRLVEIEIDEIDDSGDTCFAVRTGGIWSLQTPATSVQRRENAKTSSFVFDDDAVDAVAIFFPLYAEVTEIRYQIAED